MTRYFAHAFTARAAPPWALYEREATPPEWLSVSMSVQWARGYRRSVSLAGKEWLWCVLLLCFRQTFISTFVVCKYNYAGWILCYIRSRGRLFLAVSTYFSGGRAYMASVLKTASVTEIKVQVDALGWWKAENYAMNTWLQWYWILILLYPSSVNPIRIKLRII